MIADNMSPAAVPDDAERRHIPDGYDPSLFRLRHSLAHVLAQAVQEHFAADGHVRFGIGPPTEHGFYYDFDLPRPVAEADLPVLEERMRRILAGNHAFEMRTVTPDEARDLFAAQPYKLRLIDDLLSGARDGSVPASQADPCESDVVLTVYRQDTFVDLCRGPHVRTTAEIAPDGFKLTSVSGAYWRGDETEPALQRVYGVAFSTAADLELHLWRLAEAERRDHRRIGRELELFHLDQTAPGMPYWLPNGVRILNELLAFWRTEHEARGYREIASPLLNSKELWIRSGHWDHYKDDMYQVPVSEHVTYLLKPMNCPNAMIVFNLKTRSYRDLPLRLADCDMLHRHERSGTLHGLLRVQKIQQDDAHIFIAEDQIEAEFDEILSIAHRFYSIFGLSYRFRLGTRPSGFLGDPESWDRAEASLIAILDRHAGPGGYTIAEGDGAFYGPKIDIVMEDCLGRSWQMGTIQLDFQLPRRFGCVYTDSSGNERTPVVIHRVIYGSLERFIAILIEHTAGALPVWLAPIQARVLPITDAVNPYADDVAGELKAAGLRVDVDRESRRIGAKVREAQVQKIPYMLVVGKREQESACVSVRLRSGEDLGAMGVEACAEMVRDAVREKR